MKQLFLSHMFFRTCLKNTRSTVSIAIKIEHVQYRQFDIAFNCIKTPGEILLIQTFKL